MGTQSIIFHQDSTKCQLNAPLWPKLCCYDENCYNLNNRGEILADCQGDKTIKCQKTGQINVRCETQLNFKKCQGLGDDFSSRGHINVTLRSTIYEPPTASGIK